MPGRRVNLAWDPRHAWLHWASSIRSAGSLASPRFVNEPEASWRPLPPQASHYRQGGTRDPCERLSPPLKLLVQRFVTDFAKRPSPAFGPAGVDVSRTSESGTRSLRFGGLRTHVVSFRNRWKIFVNHFSSRFRTGTKNADGAGDSR
jgi:hypothetical protein